MSLSNTLVTNEVKNAAGTEVEFGHWEQEARSHIYQQVGETPSLPHRLKISHQESGTFRGMVRRSVVRIDKTVTGASGAPVTISAYKVLVVPVGELANLTEVSNVSAELDSFCCTTGAATAVLFDGTGNGDSCLINGSL
jgi:hypothetical protein